MSVMSILHPHLDLVLEAIHRYLDIIEAAEKSGSGCALSRQEREGILSILTPAANAVNGRYPYSPPVDASAVAEILHRRHRDDRDECRRAVTAAESKMRLGAEPLERADMHAIRHVFNALDAQRTYLSARIGGGC